MKNLKISLTAIVAAIILAISTGVYAYTGIGNVEIQAMPSSLSNGTATVSNATKYQFVEITSDKYTAIKKLEAQYKLLKAYEAYSADNTNTNLENAYSSECDSYYATYGDKNDTRDATINAVLNSYTMGSTLSEECKSKWVNELVDFNASSWTNVTDNKIQIDLSTFTGTKYYIAWVETSTSGKYYAEVYKVAGTKKDDQNNNNTTNNTTNNTVKNDTKNTTPAKNETKTNGTTNTPTTITTSKSTASKLPHTGVNDVIVGLIATASTASGIAYLRYRKIK